MLAVPSDSALVAELRRHQSWYRANILGARHGYVRRGDGWRPIGNRLDPVEVEAHDRTMAFLMDRDILTFVERRAAQGGVDQPKLFTNLLAASGVAFAFAGLIDSAVERCAG